MFNRRVCLPFNKGNEVNSKRNQNSKPEKVTLCRNKLYTGEAELRTSCDTQ